MAGEKVVADVVNRAWWKPNGSLMKSAPLIGLLGAAAVTLPFVVGGLRSSRRFDEADVPMPKDLTDPLPPVLEFTPAPPAMPMTMMGEQPVEGMFAQKEKLRRTGGMAGPDVASPNITDASGLSVIDGKHVKDLQMASSQSAPHLPG